LRLRSRQKTAKAGALVTSLPGQDRRSAGLPRTPNNRSDNLGSEIERARLTISRTGYPTRTCVLICTCLCSAIARDRSERRAPALRPAGQRRRRRFLLEANQRRRYLIALPRKHTPSFILELPLRTSPADKRACAIMLDAARNIGNAALGEGLRRLDLIVSKEFPTCAFNRIETPLRQIGIPRRR
jgi:hypothetical protein